MIELNLLPKELRKKKKKTATTAIPEIPVLPVVIGVVVVLIIVHLLLLFRIGSNRKLSVKLKDKWEQMAPQKESADAFFYEFNNLQKRVEAVRKIAKPDLSWTRLLNGLNQAMIPNVWLSEFKLTFGEKGGKLKGSKDQPASLNLTGYAVGKSEVAMPTVGKFMESLKRNKDFSDYFEEIELEDIRNFVISGEEVMMFRLDCHFKTIKSVPVEKDTAQAGKKKRKKKKR
jgi:hypothetical protein